MPAIGNAIGIPFRKSGISWQTYWLTREPSGIAVVITSDTTATVTWTDSAVLGADGYKIYAGATLKATVAIGDQSEGITGLTAGSTYVFKVVAYKGTNGSTGVTASATTFEAELTTYITGLATPLSDGQKIKINTLIRSIKTGLSITDLDDAFDVMYILAGETAESSLKNLVKNAHHITAVNAPVWAQFEGYTGANTKYLDANYNASTQGVTFTQNNASMGVY